MLSMMLVVMAAVILAASLTGAFKARTASEQKVETMRTVELVMESLRADLESALPPSRGGKFAGSFEGTSQQIDNGIEADDLVFYGTSPAPYHAEGSNGDIKQFELTCYQPTGSSDHVLVRRTFNNLLSPTGTSTAGSSAPGANTGGNSTGAQDEEILCRNVNGFTLQYFDGVDWQPFWDSTQASNQPANSLPLAVMVTLTLPSSDKTDAAGKPLLVSYTRVFQMPCNGPPPGATAGVSSGASGSSSGSKNAPAAPTGGAK